MNSDSDCELDSELETSPTLKTIFKNLYTGYRDNIKSWWEVQSLESYIKAGIVPNGLRINISPAPRSRSEQLLDNWEKELTNSSVRLLQILLDEEKKILETTSTNLKGLIDQVLKFKNDPEFARKEQNLQSNIEKFQNSLKDRKHKQYLRDLQDFKDKKAYQFLSGWESEASSSDLEASDTERSSKTNYFGKRGQGRGRSAYRGWRANRGRWQSTRGRGWEGNWYPPQGRGYTERREIPVQNLAPPHHVPNPALPTASASSSSSPFLEGQGGAPYGLRSAQEKKRAV